MSGSSRGTPWRLPSNTGVREREGETEGVDSCRQTADSKASANEFSLEGIFNFISTTY